MKKKRGKKMDEKETRKEKKIIEKVKKSTMNGKLEMKESV